MLHLFVILATVILGNEASRILAVFPSPSLSHQVVFRPLILELVKRGHDVTMLTTDPIFKKGDGPDNLTQIDVHDVSYQLIIEAIMSNQFPQGSKQDLREQMERFYDLLQILFERQFSTKEMQSILKDKTKKFDLLILEAYIFPLLGLSHVFKNVPVILMSSFGPFTDNLRVVGAPIHPLIYPTSLQQKLYNLTLWDKVSELTSFFRMEETIDVNERKFSRILKRVFGDDVPELDELKKNVDMVFLNVNPIWDMNRPVPPNVIYLGGLHQKPEKELPTDIKKYLDSSKNGVIYVSFGTNVRLELLPPEKIQTMIKVFSKLPYDILWKWNEDDLPGKTENIKISKWLPQPDLLRHPKIKLFVTQGGLQSTDEAITAGVPLVGIPMLGDQWFNVEHYINLGIGVRVEMETITEEEFSQALQTILTDRSYRDNIVRLRDLIRDQPQTPLERATWWTEYVLRHGGAKHLRSPAANMPITEYLELKLVSLILIAFLSVISVLVFILYYLYRLFNNTASNKLKRM